ncbi:diacylglycerol/lipid kinase family protein [Tabrizicola sp. BL-A-41-H6]|uniref:diacylglycerol/lipid kinase family protein n=1 Tax=Tabrizicola sp. BL-A-41-H6 TaxID=3421107 RepID=UPI003D668AB3
MPNDRAAGPDICVIANSKSGTANREVLDKALAVFGSRAVLRSFEGDPAPVAEQAVRDGYPIIVAAGGDGTVAGVAHALAGTKAAMAVLPMGTFNYFARGLNTPTDPAEAAAAILAGETHAIAVGTVNGRVFLNNVALGLYPAMLDDREATYLRFGRSRILAHWSALRTILRLQRPMRWSFVIDGVTVVRRTPMIFIARSAYQLDQFGLSGTAAISEDRFAVYIARQSTRLGLLKLAWRLLRGKVDLSSDVELIQPKTLVIDRRKRRNIRIAYDGEREKMALPLTFAIDADGLSVILPPEKAVMVKEAAS